MRFMVIVKASKESEAGILPTEQQLAEMADQNARGARIVASIALRGNGVVMAWRGTVHPFMFRPAR